MPHSRKRHLLPHLKKQAAFWPVVGVLGLRQVGKSTLFREQLKIDTYLTFDDDDTRRDAEASPKVFLAKNPRPLVIDEIQKVAPLFDAIKSAVDKKRVPGQYFITGSSAFSAQKDIQESLTGRIGLCELFPLTLAEANESELKAKLLSPNHVHASRFGIEQMAAQIEKGGMPVPMFSRDFTVRQQYWKNWIATTLGRDLARVYGKGYDADFAERILYDLVKHHEQGVFPSSGDFSYDARKAKKYLNAFRNVFMVRLLPIHPEGIGKDLYYLTDSGLAFSLMNRPMNDTISLILTKIYVLNELMANTQYAGQSVRWSYFKSQKSEPVDLVWDHIPIKILNSVKQTGWEERAVYGALKKLKASHGLMLGPTDRIHFPKKGEVGLLPWTYWS